MADAGHTDMPLPGDVIFHDLRGDPIQVPLFFRSSKAGH